MEAVAALPAAFSRQQPTLARRCVWLCAGLIVVQAVSLGYVATRLSPTPDEFPNLCAGLSYLRTGRFDLYSVNPPLIKTFAALPALAVDLRIPVVKQTARPEFDAGSELWRSGGEQAVWSLIAARWIAILFVLIGTVAVYQLGSQLRSPACGLITAALWATSPLTLAYGPLLSFDIAACSMGLMATSTFIAWLRTRSLGDALVASLWLALAVLTKFTWLLLFALWPLWVVVRRRGEREQTSESRRGDGRLGDRRGVRPLLSTSAQLAGILAVAWLLINAGYRFQEFGQPLGAFAFGSESLSGLEQEYGQPRRSANRFADSPLGSLPVLAPAPMVRGIDVQKGDFDQARPAYRLGEWHEIGIWYYYLLGFAAKLPLGMLLLLSPGIMVVLRDARWRAGGSAPDAVDSAALDGRAVSRRKRFAGRVTDEIFALIMIPGSLLLLVSAQTGMNDHFRYALILLGQLCLLAGIGATSLASEFRFRRAIPARSAAAVLLATAFVAPVATFPYCHTYCNVAFGGTRANADLLGGSAADWYQGWWAARRWLASHHDRDRRVVVRRSSWVDLEALGFETRGVDLSNGRDAILLISAADRIRLQKERPLITSRHHRVALLGGGVEAYRLTAHQLTLVSHSELREVVGF